MDVGAFRETKFERMLTYVGFDTQGITVGAGVKLGEAVYLGAAYGGSLIQDLFSRATNQDPSEMSLKVSTGTGDVEIPGVYDSVGGRPAEAKNRNEFNLFLGLWRFGLKLGFSQTLTVAQPQSEDLSMEVGKSGGRFAFENAIVPSLALGVSIPLGSSFFIIPELSAEIDVHQFVAGTDPHYSASGTGGAIIPVFYSGYTQMYNEAKVGLDLGLSSLLANGEIRGGVGYYLKKRLDGFNLDGGSKITHTVWDYGDVDTIISTYDNLEQEITPYFLYTGAIGERLTIGAKLLADIRFNEYFLTPDKAVYGYGDYETHAQETYIRPELNFGGTFAVLPSRFALHAGFGLNLHTFNISSSENKSLESKDQSLEEILPSTRFAVGFTVNLNENITIDMLLITSGRFDFKSDPDYTDISSLRRAVQDNDKFTLFLTMKM
jgi:hypothetical protein